MDIEYLLWATHAREALGHLQELVWGVLLGVQGLVADVSK